MGQVSIYPNDIGLKHMSIKTYVGNYDGQRRGLVRTTSKASACNILGMSRYSFDNFWARASTDRNDLEPGTLYTQPMNVHPSKKDLFVEGRCDLNTNLWAKDEHPVNVHSTWADNPHCLVRDDDGHWYIIPASEVAQFERWVDVMESGKEIMLNYDYSGNMIPGPHVLTFTAWTVTY